MGSISQLYATAAGSSLATTYRGNQRTGLFTDAFVTSLGQLRANRIPITEFTWQIVSSMRRGDSGTTGGGGTQVCTLPILWNLASDAKF